MSIEAGRHEKHMCTTTTTTKTKTITKTIQNKTNLRKVCKTWTSIHDETREAGDWIINGNSYGLSSIRVRVVIGLEFRIWVWVVVRDRVSIRVWV